jgi:phosphatidylinositol N-acetylglucosaminyltransferase subunit A
VLRAALNPQMVSVIPNAVVASQFKPDPGAQDPNFSKPIKIISINKFYANYLPS